MQGTTASMQSTAVAQHTDGALRPAAEIVLHLSLLLGLSLLVLVGIRLYM